MFDLNEKHVTNILKNWIYTEISSAIFTNMLNKITESNINYYLHEAVKTKLFEYTLGTWEEINYYIDTCWEKALYLSIIKLQEEYNINIILNSVTSEIINLSYNLPNILLLN